MKFGGSKTEKKFIFFSCVVQNGEFVLKTATVEEADIHKIREMKMENDYFKSEILRLQKVIDEQRPTQPEMSKFDLNLNATQDVASFWEETSDEENEDDMTIIRGDPEYSGESDDSEPGDAENDDDDEVPQNPKKKKRRLNQP